MDGPNWSLQSDGNAVRVGRRCSSGRAARRRGDTAMVQTSRRACILALAKFRARVSVSERRRRFCEKHPWGVRQMLTPCSSLGLERAPRTAARIMPRGREVTSGCAPGGLCASRVHQTARAAERVDPPCHRRLSNPASLGAPSPRNFFTTTTTPSIRHRSDVLGASRWLHTSPLWGLSTDSSYVATYLWVMLRGQMIYYLIPVPD